MTAGHSIYWRQQTWFGNTWEDWRKKEASPTLCLSFTQAGCPSDWRKQAWRNLEGMKKVNLCTVIQQCKGLSHSRYWDQMHRNEVPVWLNLGWQKLASTDRSSHVHNQQGPAAQDVRGRAAWHSCQQEVTEPECVTTRAVVPAEPGPSRSIHSIRDPGVLSHWMSVRSCEGSGAGYMWSPLKHLECCSGFLRRENTSAKVRVGSIHNLALEEIPAALFISSVLREKLGLGLEILFSNYNWVHMNKKIC